MDALRSPSSHARQARCGVTASCSSWPDRPAPMLCSSPLQLFSRFLFARSKRLARSRHRELPPSDRQCGFLCSLAPRPCVSFLLRSGAFAADNWFQVKIQLCWLIRLGFRVRDRCFDCAINDQRDSVNAWRQTVGNVATASISLDGFEHLFAISRFDSNICTLYRLPFCILHRRLE